MGLKFRDGVEGLASNPLWTPQPPPTAPSHQLWSPLSMHQKGWLQTDKYYIYNMNIYSNFNGLLMDFLFSYSFNLLYWFILVMRNNIMFCGFISFSFVELLLLLLFAVWYLWTHIHTNTHIQQIQVSNMCCSFFGESDVWLWNALFCFLITESSHHRQKPSLEFW